MESKLDTSAKPDSKCALYFSNLAPQSGWHCVRGCTASHLTGIYTTSIHSLSKYLPNSII